MRLKKEHFAASVAENGEKILVAKPIIFEGKDISVISGIIKQ